MQIPTLTFVKSSIVILYRRIFLSTSRQIFHLASGFLIVLIWIWGVAYFFSFLFICPGHPTAYWTTLRTEKEFCINTVLLHNAYGVSDFVLDVLIILLPIPLVSLLPLGQGILPSKVSDMAATNVDWKKDWRHRYLRPWDIVSRRP